MKNAWNLFTHDVHKAVSNTVGIILVLGLTLIPALFSWFNIAASWDPFGNTKNVTFAIANTDAGYKSDLIPLKINVGDQVVSTLRANDQLDWVFTSKDDAIDGTKSGKYYAAVVIPKSFSQDMLTFFSTDAKSTKLSYYTNEKKSALAPKITGQGADEVSAQINEIFTKTLGDVALNLVSTFSDYLDDADTQTLVKNLENRLQTLGAQLHSAADSTQVYLTLLDSASSLVGSASGLVDSTKGSGAEAKKSIDSALTSATSIKSTLDAASSSLSRAMKQSVNDYASLGSSMDGLFSSLDSLSSDSAATLTTLASRVNENIATYTTLRDKVQALQDGLPAGSPLSLQALISGLNDAINAQTNVRNALTDAAAKLSQAQQVSSADRQQIADLVSQAQSSLSSLKSDYDTQLQPQLASLSKQISSTASNAKSVAAGLKNAVADLSGTGDSVNEKLAKAKTAVTDFSDALNKAGDKLIDLSSGLAAAVNSGDIDQLQKIIGNDPDALATAISAPVGVTRKAVFPVATFGSAMAPLYMMVSLWVGALLMCVSIRVEVSRSTLSRLAGIKPRQIYFGRFGLFALVSLLQSVFEALGCMLFIGVQAVHPVLFLLTAWFAGLVFTFMIYTLVVSFGNAGKAVAVVLLVVQISGAGGAYPLQVLPKFFQNISPFLPATHAINALRASIAGVYQNDYWISMGYLALFILPTLLLGLVLRKPVVRLNHKFVTAVESTKML